jgi:hypothetical protein
MRFDSFREERDFAGENHEAAVSPPQARVRLERCDERAGHYAVSVELDGPAAATA